MAKENRPKIMIVEDETSVSFVLEEMLTENGYEVPCVACSGEDAIIMAKKNRPDLILMDIKLASELDGIETATKILSQLDIPSVFLTGYGNEELVDRASEADPLGYLMKPSKMVQILATIRLALQKINRKKRNENSPEFRCISSALVGLSAQQLRVADMIREGRENGEISEKLGIAIDTVNWHRKRIRKKLHIDKTSADLMVALRVLY